MFKNSFSHGKQTITSILTDNYQLHTHFINENKFNLNVAIKKIRPNQMSSRSRSKVSLLPFFFHSSKRTNHIKQIVH